MAEEVKTVEPVKAKVDIKKWKNRKLKFINEMTNKAKAEAIAKRVLQYK